MPIVDFQPVFVAVRKVFKSHKTLEAESNSRLMPVKVQIEDIFKKPGLTNIKVVLAYVKELWDSKFGLEGSYLKSQEKTYESAAEEANKLLRKNRIQCYLIRASSHKHGSDMVEVFPDYITAGSSFTVKDVFIPRDGNWDR